MNENQRTTWENLIVWVAALLFCLWVWQGVVCAAWVFGLLLKVLK